MKIKLSTKRFFNYVEQDQLPFMVKITVKSSYPRALKSYNFVWNIIPQKSLFISRMLGSKVIYNMFCASCCKWLENNFLNWYFLKMTIFWSDRTFFIFYIFNTRWISVKDYQRQSGYCKSLWPRYVVDFVI